MPGVAPTSLRGLVGAAAGSLRPPGSGSGLWARRILRLGAFVVLAVMVPAFNTRGLRAPDSESVSLAPPLSVSLSAPAGSIAPTIRTANTALLPDPPLATPAGRTIVTQP